MVVLLLSIIPHGMDNILIQHLFFLMLAIGLAWDD